MYHFRLTVPAPGRVENPSLMRNPARLRAWTDDLPFAIPTDAGQSLLRALSLLNRHALPAADRLDLMAVYQSPYDTLLDITRRVLHKQTSFTGPGPLQTLLQLLGKLTREMGYGYKLAINDGIGDPSHRRKGPGLEEALYFASKQLALELMVRYTLYEEAPRSAWRELYLLYREAERCALADTSVSDPGESLGSSDVASNLKRIILLSLLDPYRKQPHEVWQVYGFLGHHAPGARIEALPQAAEATGCFVFDLDGSDPPYLCTTPGCLKNRESLRRLNTGELLGVLDQQLVSIRQGGYTAPSGLEAMAEVDAVQLLLGMRIAWKIPPKRRHPRHEAYTWLNAACGVGAAHHRLSARRPDDPAQGSDEAEPTDIELGGLSQAPSADKPASYPVFRWRQVNRSDSGAAVHVPLPSTASLQVGQLVLFETDQGGPDADTVGGIVRRFRHIDPSTLEVGIEFLGENMRPITLRPVEGSGASGGFRAAISVTPRAAARSSHEIITERGLFGKNREYVVEIGGDYIQLRALTLLESTHRFERFEARAVPLTAPIQPETPVEEAQDESDASAALDDPWHYVEVPRTQR